MRAYYVEDSDTLSLRDRNNYITHELYVSSRGGKDSARRRAQQTAKHGRAASYR